MDLITCILLIIISTSFALLNPEIRPKKCLEQKNYGMLGYFCNHLDLEEVPKTIKPSIEILDLSHNYIWYLNSESFLTCPKVKYIYLQFNSIANVTLGTFSQLLQLEVLDLSKNVLTRIPGEIFLLPQLRSLYLERNIFDSHAFEAIPNPVKAPLKKLNLADNNLNHIPSEFGILPELRHLNISSNRMMELTPQQFSPFCNLKEVDLNNTLLDKCKCLKIVEFLTFNRNISIVPTFCKTPIYYIEECDKSMQNETEEYSNCVMSYQQLTEERKTKTTLKSAGIYGLLFLIVFIGFLFCVQQMTMKKKTSSRQAIPIQGSPYYNNFTHHNPISKESDV